ncbi:hypothetical protein [uncultured Paludibaculum sp.]|uniref:TOTE conflict system archaeo-eukaryotic primase domain-containing protein n=1 Tax=uncultured Paludibaculum sp. TaxID=1765020 RepID=UPI002AAB1DA2|nr:hypothetical protein [uncultured Paludibaculum sp.]
MSETTKTSDAASALARRFHARFMGMEKAHGAYANIGKTVRDNGKLTGDPVTKRLPVTDELWHAHLEGRYGLGVITIMENDSVLWGCIDIDVYDSLDHGQTAARLAQLQLPLILCRSKSGGAHLFLFGREPIPAATMRERLRDLAARIGHGSAEIFPKQSRTTEKDLGSWVNMPYCGGDTSNRYGVQPTGDPYTMEEFLKAADALAVGPEFFQERKQQHKGDENPEFRDGPPCLAILAEQKVPEGCRNDALLAFGIFGRRKFTAEWRQKVYEYNRKCFAEPLSEQEVEGTVLKTLAKEKEYRYGCSKPPLNQHCNASLCRMRKYGIGGGRVPEYGPLMQHEGDEPVWTWFIDGVPVHLTTQQLHRYTLFQEAILKAVRTCPPPTKQDDWVNTLNKFMENVQVIPCPEDTTREGEFWELVEHFCRNKASAEGMEDMLASPNKVFDPEDGRVYFKLAGLMAVLKRYTFKVDRGEVRRLLEKRGGKDHRDDNTGSTRRYWSVPAPARRESLPVPKRIDDITMF